MTTHWNKTDFLFSHPGNDQISQSVLKFVYVAKIPVLIESDIWDFFLALIDRLVASGFFPN